MLIAVSALFRSRSQCAGVIILRGLLGRKGHWLGSVSSLLESIAILVLLLSGFMHVVDTLGLLPHLIVQLVHRR